MDDDRIVDDQGGLAVGVDFLNARSGLRVSDLPNPEAVTERCSRWLPAMAYTPM